MDLNQFMQQATRVQQELEKVQKELEVKEFEGQASNGLVKVRMNGANKVIDVLIDDEVIGDKEMLQDLILIAVNDCLAIIDKERNSTLTNVENKFKYSR